MVSRLLGAAQDRWRRLDDHNHLLELVVGLISDRIEVSQPTAVA